MFAFNLRRGRSTRRSVRARVERDATCFVATWGDQAADMARLHQLRIGAGLCDEKPAGFWDCVAQAIGSGTAGGAAPCPAAITPG